MEGLREEWNLRTMTEANFWADMSQERRTCNLQKEIERKSACQPLGGIAARPLLYGTKKDEKSGTLDLGKNVGNFKWLKKGTIKNMEHNMECSVAGRIILGSRSVSKKVQKSDNESDFLSVKKKHDNPFLREKRTQGLDIGHRNEKWDHIY